MSADDSSHVPRWVSMSPLAGYFDSPPRSVDVQVEFGAQSRRGPLRSTNENHYLILRLGRQQETLMTSVPEGELPRRFDEFAYGMVVADGVGQAGEMASRLAITTFAHLAVYFGKWNVRINEPIANDVMDRGERFYRAVDSTLVQAGRSRPLGLQTTLTVVYTAGSDLFFAHVGHSRAYLYRDGELLRLTKDHALGDGRLGRPAINVAASAQDLHHTLKDAIRRGGAGGPRIDIERCGLLDGDAVLLCTSGLTRVVDEARIASVLRVSRTPDDQCRTLVDLAFEAGGEDDVTALVAHYRIPV